MRGRLKPEESLQRTVAEYLDWAILGKRWRWFHIPNGAGKMTIFQGARWKKMGVKAGAPDIMIQTAQGKCIEIELKAGKNKQTPAQKVWQKKGIQLGIPYYLCRDLSDVQNVLETEGLV